MPYTGNVTLGLSDEYHDLTAVDVDAYEQARASQRGMLQETPEKVRRMLLESAMGKEHFVKRLAQEETALTRTRQCRQVCLSRAHFWLYVMLDVVHLPNLVWDRTPSQTIRDTWRRSTTPTAMRCISAWTLARQIATI